jgi:hypothetical protein
MTTKFSTFLEESKIDSRRLVAVSHRLERLSDEDRTFLADAARKRALAGRKEAANMKREKHKLHSRRPITPATVDLASAGKKLGGPTKTRMLRAINHILTQRKQPVVELKALF